VKGSVTLLLHGALATRAPARPVDSTLMTCQEAEDD
jgi:hypothetical protein